MNNQKGFLSIESKNIFSILKKWLYTDQDIVFRELISNASDAIEKLCTLNEIKNSKNEAEDSIPTPSTFTQGKITVSIELEKKCIVISDNGIGMTVNEVQKYINQIAFSGATEFINQQTQSDTDAIIGHFGVGFYSAFMLADHVAIETKSFKDNTLAVRWDCQSDMAFEMTESSKTTHGTDIILYLSANSPYLNQPELVHNIIKKYFVFLKTKIYFIAPGYDSVLVNDPDPIWKNTAVEVDKADMDTFYKTFYDDVSEPLFWVKFESIDIGIRGILFFRDTKNGTSELDGTFKVYNRGVYVGENIKELIPKFVNLQNGIIECDHLPLVVSRSTIRGEQTDNLTSLIYESLSQEMTIAINDIFQNKRALYEQHWSNLNAFVKYGVLQDKVFASVMTNKVIFEDIYGSYKTIKEYLEDTTNTHSSTVYYASDALEQAHYIEIFKKCQLNALLFDHVIDQPFMRKQELVHSNTQFVRIDSNIEALFEGSLSTEDEPLVERLTEKIRIALGDKLNNITLKITNLDQDSITTLIINDEKSRRMADMLEIYGMIKPSDNPLKELQSKSIYLVNMNNKIVRYCLNSQEDHMVTLVINQLFDLALMSQGTLSLEHVENFIVRSENLLEKLA